MRVSLFADFPAFYFVLLKHIVAIERRGDMTHFSIPRSQNSRDGLIAQSFRAALISVALLFSMQPLNAAENCTALSETCTAYGTLTQNSFTMRNVCIERAVVYECVTEREINHCAPLASDARCEFIAETCAQRKDGLCVDFESTYGCTDGELEYEHATLKDRSLLSIAEDWTTDCQNSDACVLEQTTCTEGPETRTVKDYRLTPVGKRQRNPL